MRLKHILRFQKEVKEHNEINNCKLCGLTRNCSYVLCPIFAENNFEFDMGIKICKKCDDFLNSNYKLTDDFKLPKIKKEKTELEIYYILKALKNKILSKEEFIIIRDNYIEGVNKYVEKKKKEAKKRQKIKLEKTIIDIKKRYLK